MALGSRDDGEPNFAAFHGNSRLNLRSFHWKPFVNGDEHEVEAEWDDEAAYF